MGHTPRWLRQQRAARLNEERRDKCAPLYETNLETYKREIGRWAEWPGKVVLSE